MNWIIKNFLRGLVIVVPVVTTVYVVWVAFTKMNAVFGTATPGLGIAVAFAATVAIGALASNFVVRRLLRILEIVFTRAPLVRLIYGSIRDLLEAFVGDKKRFDRPVSVALSDDGAVRTLGFVTQDDLAFLGLPGDMAVYMPLSYSMAGMVVVVPATRVTALDTDSASLMTLVVSGGVSRGERR